MFLVIWTTTLSSDCKWATLGFVAVNSFAIVLNANEATIGPTIGWYNYGGKIWGVGFGYKIGLLVEIGGFDYL